MAITILNGLALLEAWRDGVSFEKTLTLGRLECFMSMRDLQRVARLMPPGAAFVESVRGGVPPRFAEDFFKAMGATNIASLDASDFEGASIIHDLNEPLAAHLHSRFSAVVDGGTLEHVFNVPMAFKNAMDALQVGGYFLACLPANNFCGHGFYQFSAEFFFEVFSATNGFEMDKLFVAPAYAAGKWLDGPVFEVANPRTLQARVEIEGRRKMFFLVRARKVEQRTVFATWPQQSDYLREWKAASDSKQSQVAAAPRGPAVPTVGWVRRVAGVHRLFIRQKEQRNWKRQSSRNPALTPHRWIE